MRMREKDLARLRVAAPCESSWEGMPGDGRRRYCAQCERHVYDLAQLTPRQIAGLVEATGGALCARLSRDAAGRLVTLPWPTSAPALQTPEPLGRRRSSPLAAAAVAAVLGFSGAAAAGGSDPVAPAPAVVAQGSETGGDRQPADGARERAGDPGGSLAGTLASDAGAPIPNAEVRLESELDREERTARTDEAGRFSFSSLPAGIYSLAAWSRGYHLVRQENVLLRAGEAGRVALAAPASVWQQALSGAPAGIPLGGAIAMVEDPIRRLFADAGVVVFGVVGKSVVVQKEEHTWEVRTDVAVSSVAKGDTNERTISIFHDQMPQMPDEELDSRWQPGERVLAFLDPREAEDGRGLAGYTAHTPWGVKTLSATELAAYGRRLDALARLAQIERGAARPADIVEWLVATAEEPATREDGVRELGPAVAELELEARQHAVPAARYAEDLRAVVGDYLRAGGRPEGDLSPAVLAAYLTDAQRERLASALLATTDVTSVDLDLYELVDRWHDDRLLPWMIDRIAAGDVLGGTGRRALSLVAKELDDDDLADLLTTGEEPIDALEQQLQAAPDDASRQAIVDRLDAAESDLRQRFVAAIGGRLAP